MWYSGLHFSRSRSPHATTGRQSFSQRCAQQRAVRGSPVNAHSRSARATDYSLRRLRYAATVQAAGGRWQGVREGENVAKTSASSERQATRRRTCECRGNWMRRKRGRRFQSQYRYFGSAPSKVQGAACSRPSSTVTSSPLDDAQKQTRGPLSTRDTFYTTLAVRDAGQTVGTLLLGCCEALA